MNTSSELSPGELSAMIGAIYDCALDPQRWASALEQICSVLGYGNSSLVLQALPLGEPLLSVATGVSEYYRARAFEHGADIIEIWGGIDNMNQAPLEEPAVFSRVGNQSTWTHNRYMLEWVRPQGIIDCVAVVLQRDSRTYGSVGFGRHASAGPLGEHDIDAMRLLVPHLQRAAAISRMLDVQSVVASSFAAALDVLPSATVLVGSDMHIVHANEAAARLLAKGDPIIGHGGTLSLRDQAANAALALAVRHADNDEATFGRRGFGIPAPFIDGRPSLLHVLPLRHGQLRAGLTPHASAAIFLAPAALPLPASREAMAVLFDLTPAEARVFAHVASGETVASTSKSLGVSDSTIKTHLLRLFAKTGTRRQAELVKLAASLAMFT